MKLNSKTPLLGTIAAASVFLELSLNAVADNVHRATLPVGTVIPARLNEPLSSKENRPGDHFTATLREGSDDAGIPAGTRFEGVVREAVPSRNGKPGVLDVEFVRLVPRSGSPIEIDGSLYAINGKTVTSKDGRLVASTDKNKDRVKWVGIGAGAGVLLSGVTKGNAIVDAVLGAGAGYLYNELQKKKAGDVSLKQGAEFGVRLDRPVQTVIRTDLNKRGAVPAARLNDDRYYRPGTGETDSRRIDRGLQDERATRDERDEVRTGRHSDIGVILDGKEVRFGEDHPFRTGDVLMVAVEPFAKAAGIEWKLDLNSKTIMMDGNNIKLALNSRVVIVRGERKLLAASAIQRSGSVFVPAEALGYAIGGSFYWDAPSQTGVYTSRKVDRE